MSNDEMNRKMDFIVEHQAQFAADIQQLTERQERFQQDLERLHGDVVVLRETANAAIETSTQTAEIVATIAEAQVEGQRQIAETERQLTHLAELVELHVGDSHQHDGSLS